METQFSRHSILLKKIKGVAVVFQPYDVPSWSEYLIWNISFSKLNLLLVYFLNPLMRAHTQTECRETLSNRQFGSRPFPGSSMGFAVTSQVGARAHLLRPRFLYWALRAPQLRWPQRSNTLAGVNTFFVGKPKQIVETKRRRPCHLERYSMGYFGSTGGKVEFLLGGRYWIFW